MLNNLNLNNINFDKKTNENEEIISDLNKKMEEIPNSPEIKIFCKKIEDYTIGKEIGKGAYAIVKSGFHKPTKTKVAIKIYEKFRLLDSQRKEASKKEIQILKKLDHPNIVRLIEVIDMPKQVNSIKLQSYI